MKMRRSLTGMITLCAALFLLVGCSRSPRITYYALNAVATPAESAAPAIESVAIGPVTLPEMLDRPMLVVRTTANRLDILEFYRWAAPLKNEIPRVIAADLTLLLNQARVSTYPQNADLAADYRIVIDIQRFEMTAGEGVALDALWSVRRADGGTAKTGRSVISESAGAAGYDALVAAQSRALAAVSRDLAQALRAEAAAR
jgi:uncharacterized lipoprotein YmbA